MLLAAVMEMGSDRRGWGGREELEEGARGGAVGLSFHSLTAASRAPGTPASKAAADTHRRPVFAHGRVGSEGILPSCVLCKNGFDGNVSSLPPPHHHHPRV